MHHKKEAPPIHIEEAPPVLTAQHWLHILGRSLVNVEHKGVPISYEFRQGALCIILKSVSIKEGELRLEEVPPPHRHPRHTKPPITAHHTLNAIIAAINKPLNYFRRKRSHLNGP